jgi:hypothetical protein
MTPSYPTLAALVTCIALLMLLVPVRRVLMHCMGFLAGSLLFLLVIAFASEIFSHSAEHTLIIQQYNQAALVAVLKDMDTP